MNGIFEYISVLMRASIVTVAAWLIAATVSLVFGIMFGIASCAYRGWHLAQWLIYCYTFVIKGIPAYVQILIAYFVVPQLLGVSVSGFVAATGALALCSSGYVTDIIRAGIDAVPQGQWEACAVLGLPARATLCHVIMPQALRIIILPLFGEAEQLLKSTCLLAMIGVTELTRAGMNIISRELNPAIIYMLIAIIYLCFSGLLQIVIFFVNRFVKKH